MSKAVFALSLAILGGAVCINAQSFVQISSIRAYPARLTCVGPGAISKVRVQIYLAGIPEAAKQKTVSLNLSISSAHPSTSKIDIRDADQEVPLSDSPALVDFQAVCTGDTLPGVISIGATIVSAPDGVLIKEPAQPAIIELKIEPPH